MGKAISWILAGGLLGAGAAYLVIGSADNPSLSTSGSKSLLQSVADFTLGRDPAPAIQSVSVAESLAVYQTAAAETDLVRLQSALEMLASAPWSPAGDLEIDASLARLSELAPAHAASLAHALNLETRFVADAYIHWAEVDAQAALDGLGAIASRVQRREVALTLLDVVGDDDAGLEKVAAGLPESERDSLRVDRLARRAAYDPYGAFRDAQRLGGIELQRRALLQIARAWAEQDPQSALSQADFLPDQLRSQYRQSVLDEWARLDSAGYLAWLETAASPPEEAIVGVRLLAATQPERVLGIADRMSGTLARSLRAAALNALAEIDPEAAMARAEALPPGSDRDTLLSAIGSALAQRDPDAALAWAERVSPQSRNVMMQVAMQIVQGDPERAIAFLDEPPAGIDPQLVSSLLGSVMARDPETSRMLADQLVASDSIQAANTLRNLIGNWIQQDPERALEWVRAHEADVDAAVLGNAAQSMARADPAAAASYVDRIPAEYRSAWIAQVAGPYALQDMNAALAWVGRFQGEPIYDSALRQVIAASAQIDARRAAQLLSQASADVQLGAAQQVAAAWASQEPRAAARWAASLNDSRARQGAVNAAVSAWASADPGAARSFVLDLDRGEERDEALNALVTRIAASGDFDRSLLNAYDSERARQEVLTRAIPLVSRNDPEAARELLGLVTNGNTRRQIEEQIQSVNALR